MGLRGFSHGYSSSLFPLLAALLAATTLPAHAQTARSEEQEKRIYLGKPDGSEMKPLVVVPGYNSHGSPTWSQDGVKIAFDAHRTEKANDGGQDAWIIVADADGGDPRVLGDGAMPSFSPRRNRIAFSRYAPNQGVWVMSADGPEKELVLLDEQGWSAEWSPDGKQILYAVTSGTGANFVAFDLIEGVKINLFEEDDLPYSSVFWNFCWSPDGRWIVFKGQPKNGGKPVIAAVDARGAKHGHIVRLEVDTQLNFNWTPDSKSILFSQSDPERGNRQQLFLMDLATKDPPRLLPGQDPERANNAGCFSPDGKRLLTISRKPLAGKGANKKDPAP